jgi:hypothetical protein
MGHHDLLDQLVGTNEERQWYFKPKYLRRPEVDEKLDLGRLLDGEIGGLRALEDPVNVKGSPAVHVEVIRAIPDQSALRCRYWPS